MFILYSHLYLQFFVEFGFWQMKDVQIGVRLAGLRVLINTIFKKVYEMTGRVKLRQHSNVIYGNNLLASSGGAAAWALSARCQSLSNRIEQSRLAWRHRSLIWLTDEHTIDSNLFGTKETEVKKKLNGPALDKMDGVIPGLLGFSPLLVGHGGRGT